jgi:hypothetical protein
LLIEAIPEGGQFRPGVENILYVLTSYPDGSPAETELVVEFYQEDQTVETATGPYSVAEVPIIPTSPFQTAQVRARDVNGRTAQREFYFEGEDFQQSVLLRPEKPVYRIGQSMALTVLTSHPRGSVYLDIVREGQTISTRAIDVENGRAEIVVDLTLEMYGTLELHAYKILPSGTITRDTRLVVVDNAQDLNISITPDRPGFQDLSDVTYLPGDSAALNLQVSGIDGAGVQAAFGMAIVDESVFAWPSRTPASPSCTSCSRASCCSPNMICTASACLTC